MLLDKPHPYQFFNQPHSWILNVEKKIIGEDYLSARASGVKFHDIKKRVGGGIVKAISQWQKQELLLLRDYKFWTVNVTYHTWIFRKIKIFKISSQDIDYPKVTENLFLIYFGNLWNNLGCKTEARSNFQCK